MFKKIRKPTSREMAIERLLYDMSCTEPWTKEFEEMTKRLDTLMRLKDFDKSRWAPSSDTIALILGNASIALVVTKYEQFNVIGTKLFQFLMKFK